MPNGFGKETIVIPQSFRLENDLMKAYHFMEYTSDCVFLTGRAGTGKSTLLNFFRKNTIKKYIVLAPTGLAALQVGGSTIHSFFGFPLRKILKDDPDITAWGKGHPRRKVLREMDTLIIDEVSMVRNDIMEAINLSLCLNMGNDLPFGGKQVIFIGDIFQLSPVVTTQDRVEDEDDFYEIPYFFGADSFRLCHPRIVELNKIYRQHDEDFIYLLNRIRMGFADHDELEELNKRYSLQRMHEEFAITLTSINAIADGVNFCKLAEIKSSAFQYKGTVEGLFNDRLYPAPLTLNLRKGAQVMMVKNDLEGRWVNGSIGAVDYIDDVEIKIRFADGQVHLIDRVTWENKNYRWDRATNSISFEVLGTYTQYPIRLAWAITIHKSQGLTFDKVIIDLGKGAFAHGQLYVALSRCRTFQGITLRTKINMKDIIVDEVVENFARKCRMR
jgi:ATP-dependent exoDNAse (exonuclease V) alpha subunit